MELISLILFLEVVSLKRFGFFFFFFFFFFFLDFSFQNHYSDNYSLPPQLIGLKANLLSNLCSN